MPVAGNKELEDQAASLFVATSGVKQGSVFRPFYIFDNDKLPLFSFEWFRGWNK